MATQQVKSMVSEVSICNQALSFLAAVRISSLDDVSKQASWMRDNYPFIRDAVIESRLWTFATVRDQSTTADLDPWGVQFSHAAPLDWLRVLKVYSDPYNHSESQQCEWYLEGNRIITPEATVYMYGVKRITDTAIFSAMFVQALAARIAADACIPFTENVKLQGDLWILYEKKLKEAASNDGQQGRNQKLKSGSLVRVRKAGSNHVGATV